MAAVKFPFYVISGDYIFVTEDLYLTAPQQLTFWTREELNAWIVDNAGKLKSNKAEAIIDYSAGAILKAWWARLKAWWRG